MIGFLLEAYGNAPDVGRTVVDTVEKATGRPPRTFGPWAGEARLRLHGVRPGVTDAARGTGQGEPHHR